jgi:glutaredoxin 3
LIEVKGRLQLNQKHKIEIFSAGCSVCNDTIRLVKTISGLENEVHVLDMHQQDVAKRAEEHGVRSVPAVMVDGKLARCCTGRGPDEQTLREALR